MPPNPRKGVLAGASHAGGSRFPLRAVRRSPEQPLTRALVTPSSPPPLSSIPDWLEMLTLYIFQTCFEAFETLSLCPHVYAKDNLYENLSQTYLITNYTHRH